MKKFFALLTVAMIGLAAFKADNGYKVGDVAADFKLKNVDGKMYRWPTIKQLKVL